MSHDPSIKPIDPAAQDIPLVRLGQGDYTRDIYPQDLQPPECPPVCPPQRPQPEGRAALTATRLATLRRCPRQHYFRYELGLSRIRTGDALRLGSAFHRGLERHNQGLDDELSIADAVSGYANVPQWADPVDWEVEYETVRHLLAGHFWRYPRNSENDLRIVEVERSFELPLINPETGASSRTFVLAGKIDAIVQLPDGRFAVLEYKTVGEDIGAESDYWRRLRCDPQISQYVLAARFLGYDVSTVIYDVTRKPTIRPRKGESPQQYGDRLNTDIGDRPDYYFARREVPRLDDELAEFQVELWQQAKQLLDSRRHGRWFRNVNRMTCSYCDFADICLNSVRVAPGSAPTGFQFLSDVHPELFTGDLA